MARTVGSYATRRVAPNLQRVWRSMRILRTFTRGQLITVSEAGQTLVEKYTAALIRAGFVVVAKPRVSGSPGSHDVLRLVRGLDSPVAPIRRKDGNGVYDPNTGIAWGNDGRPMAEAAETPEPGVETKQPVAETKQPVVETAEPAPEPAEAAS